MLSIQEKADQLLENEELCDHCLGRQFAQLGHGLENFERGQIIRNTEELDEDDFVRENVPEDAEIGGECEICEGVFDELDRWADMVEDSFERYELETFLIGIRPREESVRAEEELWEEYGVEWTEPLKTELSRLLGKKMEERLDIQVDFDRADIMAVVDMREGRERVELQVNSLLIYGQYNKYSREIPQTEWHCRNCRGSGCEECDWTGHQYPTSVQQEIEGPFLRESKAVESKFHGCVAYDSKLGRVSASEVEVGNSIPTFREDTESSDSVEVEDSLTFMAQDIKTVEVNTWTGKNLVTTTSHPFNTRDGFVVAGKLDKSDEVLVRERKENYSSSGNRIADKEDLHSVMDEYFESVNRDKIFRELASKGLLPLESSHENIRSISRLIGVLLGDGSAMVTRDRDTTLAFYGGKPQIKGITEEIESLGFETSLERCRKSETTVTSAEGKEKLISGDCNEVAVYSKSLWTLLVALGVPVGEKTKKEFEVPNWIMEGSKCVKMNFVSALLGCEAETPRIDNREYNRKSMTSIKFSLNKIESQKDSAEKYALQLKEILEEFDVETGKIRTNKYTQRDDGCLSYKIAFDIKNNYQNMIDFLENVGFEVHKEKKERSLAFLAYLKTKRREIENRKEAYRTAVELDDKGMKLSKIHEKVSDWVTKSNLWTWLNRDLNPLENMKAKNSFPTFNEWYEENWNDDGYYWDRIESIQKTEIDKLTSLEVSKPHTFTANGFLTHNSGREDVDAKCFGKREFVLELIEPLNRNLNLEELKEEVNESTDKVEIFNIQYTHKDKAPEIKQKHSDKEYRAVVETEDEITEEDLENISEVVGEIEQETPERVEHRRAEKTREREVLEVDWEKTGEKEFELEVKAEAGTYIKELIHGDEGRTQPNISELVGTPCECVQLDVIWIEK